MQVRQKNNFKNPSNGGFLEVLKNYWFVILGLFLVVPFLIRYLKDANVGILINNMQEEEKVLKEKASNPITQLQGLQAITTRTDLHEIARNTAYHLGTNLRTKEVGIFNVDFWNPRGWTENDEKAYNELKKINYISSRDLVIKCYFFLTRRNLMDDVKKLLDEKYKVKLPLFK